MAWRTMLACALLAFVAGCEETTPDPEVGAVVELTDANFENVVLHSSQPVLVDFSATWCGPCEQMAPIVAEIAADYQGKATVAKVDVDESPAVAQKYRASVIPLFVIFKDGKEIDRIEGGGPREKLTGPLDSALQAG